jgi:peptidoglycan-associated lipoprotein
MIRFERMGRVVTQAALWGAVALLAGCASGVNLNNEVPVETRSVGDKADAAKAGNAGGASSGTAQSQVATVDLSKGDASNTLAGGEAGRVVYFDFDSFTIKDDFRPVVESNAKLLAASKQKRMTIEGHTDERGGREYNLALGQKRAEAVQKALVLLGVGEGQIESVSYGEERPAAQGSDEAAWAKNRRAELKDR